MTTTLARAAVCAFWLLCSAIGIKVIINYENTSGQSGQTPQHWPLQSTIRPDSNQDTLIMFVHPKCPCTRASIEELNRLLAAYGGPVAARVYFFKPGTESEGWTHTDLWQSASRIPGVTVYDDIDGPLAQQFGAETSGFVVLYDPQGNLLFKGGITGSRGHIGDNPGEDALLSLLSRKNPITRQTPVYGCSLLTKTCLTNSPIQ